MAPTGTASSSAARSSARQLDVERGRVLLEVAAALGAGNRDHVLALGQHPRERELAGRDLLVGGQRLDPLDQLQVGVEVLAGEAGHRSAPEVAVLQVVRRLEPPGQEAAAERAVGHEADAQLAHRVEQDLALHVAGPQRVLGLEGGDRVDRVRPADGLGRRLGQAEVAHLARLHQLAHGADRLLDRRLRVHPVLVVEVDVVEAEPAQRVVARLLDVLGPAVHAAVRRVVSADDAELGGQHDLVAPVGDRAADQLLVGAAAVHVGGVEEAHAQLERAVDRRDRFGVVALAVELGHPHAAQPLGGCGQSLFAEWSLVDHADDVSRRHTRQRPRSSAPARARPRPGRAAAGTTGSGARPPVRTARSRRGR